MKSVPLTSRGPVDDNNFPWVESKPRLYQSKGELGFRGMRHELPNPSSHHRRGRTTGSMPTPSLFEDRESVVLPKIATGRSAKSAKKMWQDYENIKIKTRIQNELETPQMPPLYVPKNPKPLYKRPVDEWKPFDILHFREFAEQGEIEPEDVTDCNQFYSQVTFLRNAVRNIDGTTSYQNLCKKPRSWSESSVTDDQPGLIAGNRLHWGSASSSLPHPRMLLPLRPGPNTKWYAWRVAAPSKTSSDKQQSKRKTQHDRHGAFLDAFSPRVAPHPTPATFKAPHTTDTAEGYTPKPSGRLPVSDEGNPSSSPDPKTTSQQDGDKLDNNPTVEPKGLTFITESKDETRDQTELKHEDANVSQETPKEDAAQEQENDVTSGQGTSKNDQSGDVQEEDGNPQTTGPGDDKAGATNPHQDVVTTEEKQNTEMQDGDESSPAGEAHNSSETDQNPTVDNDDTQAGEVHTENNDTKTNEDDPEIDPAKDNTNADGPVSDINNDITENAEPAKEDIIQGDGTPIDQSIDQGVLSVEETSGAANQCDVTEEGVVPADDEVEQSSNAPDSPGSPDKETGELSDQPHDSSD